MSHKYLGCTKSCINMKVIFSIRFSVLYPPVTNTHSPDEDEIKARPTVLRGVLDGIEDILVGRTADGDLDTALGL